MQQASNGGAVSSGQQNGATSDSGGPQTNGNLSTETDIDANRVNGEASPSLGPPKIMDKTNQDIVRLIGQHLKTVGLEYVLSINRLSLNLNPTYVFQFLFFIFPSFIK